MDTKFIKVSYRLHTCKSENIKSFLQNFLLTIMFYDQKEEKFFFGHLRIHDVTSSNLGREKGYPEQDFRGHTQPFQLDKWLVS